MKKPRLFILLILSLIVIVSCRKEVFVDYIIEKLSNEDPFVREARLSFQTEYGKKKVHFRSSVASVAPDRDRKITINIQPAWSYAKNINTAKLQGLEIPILESIASRKMFNYDKTPISPEDNKLRSKNSFKRLLYYKTRSGKSFNIILSYLPDVAYVKKFSGRISKGSLSMRTIKAMKYSGYIEYSRLNGRGIFVLQFKEGKIIRRHIYKYKNSTKLSETNLAFKSASNNIQIKNSSHSTPIASSMGPGMGECEECTPIMIRVCAGELEEEEVEDEDCGEWVDSGSEECTPIECEDEGGDEDPYPPCYPDCDPCEEPDGFYICDPDNPDPEDPYVDCNGDENGSAYIGLCGCMGGNTGIWDCEEEETPCGKAKRLAQELKNALNDVGVNSQMNLLKSLHNNSSVEHGFAIKKTANGYEVTPIVSGTANSVSFSGLDSDVIVLVHTHPASTGSAIHSSTDIYGLNDFRSNPDFLGSIVVRGSDMHALSITDGDKYDAFIQKSNQKGWYDQTNPTGWKEKTVIYRDYKRFQDNIKGVYQGGDLTYPTQLYMIEKYNMGVTFQEWKNGSFESRRIDLEYNNSAGSSTTIGGGGNVINSPYTEINIEVKCKD